MAHTQESIRTDVRKPKEEGEVIKKKGKKRKRKEKETTAFMRSVLLHRACAFFIRNDERDENKENNEWERRGKRKEKNEGGRV